ncbi:nucleotidyltransferase domain-containing protein [Streptomyces flaveus]|uniref:Polymerase nucleotidyl transferase domain-containing protein n=1 Tax=Streptomyces flaveus TaxID=66370 RepID=A0A917RJ24_9ACTN|nr:nucleotidyltransferase domain-containing protein [Streptomyces flaveus]GGL10417.1 hypothetical protein GCM10010094_84070 [Streptomyces flaveus]
MDGRQQQQTPNSAIGRSRQSGAALVALPVGARRVLPSLLDEIQSALGDQLLGVYLYGSVVGGDFDEGVSDIDLVVAFADAVDQSMMGRLETAHYRFWQTHPDFVDRIDLVYAPAAVLSGRPPSDGGSSGLPLLASVSPGSPLHTTPATRSWALNWQQARDAGATLTGRPVESVVRPVPVDEVRAVVAAEALSLRERIPETHHREAMPTSS